MKIFVGADIVDIRRIERAIVRFGNKFMSRIFTKNEEIYAFSSPFPHRSFAKRFAGKEAVVKALGIGIAHGVSWRDIEILNDGNGKPYVELSENILRKCFLYNFLRSNFELDISLSDEYPYAQAFVVVYYHES
ncbi:holo-ACP synthase [Candidatus Hydrogenosomobacter endosymbioticus]|uniref:Holo-[acyl-carrier-protein] synthase n=1 Tax=Candidatus Hydrogenosomobacter endosymbioticus TaxID=2558174 RepID=A0ABN6L600_9PROT|nr:holo-ACP synthase [Candidatus Hydrogenosomobacter endosymbioticus]BDB95926.1 holo-[acyl-carrier-protein] synthase [Candidatus Hydrogenosomobacter endosymbioticus]